MLKKKTNKNFTMKTTGIVLLVIGILSTIGALMAASSGHRTSFGGVTLAVIGAFLISRANTKKEEEDKKQKWENNDEVNNQ